MGLMGRQDGRVGDARGRWGDAGPRAVLLSLMHPWLVGGGDAHIIGEGFAPSTHTLQVVGMVGSSNFDIVSLEQIYKAAVHGETGVGSVFMAFRRFGGEDAGAAFRVRRIQCVL